MGVKNVYFLVFFACCREVAQLSKLEIKTPAKNNLEKTDIEEIHTSTRGVDAVVDNKISNFILSFGCRPGSGVVANTKYIENIKLLFISNFD